MLRPKILKVAIDIPLRRTFDYIAPEEESIKILPGMRVKVPFGRKKTMGVITEITQTSTVEFKKLKHIEKIIDDLPLLTPGVLKLAKWASDYYQCPLGEVIFSCIPPLLRKEKNLKELPEEKYITELSYEKLNPNLDQTSAINTIIAAKGFTPFLLDGVTGSGKTEVYMHAIENTLAHQHQAMILVPEIGLTPQIIRRFQSRFNGIPLIALHSGLSDVERARAWLKARSGEARIIIGTRSAIFTPAPKLGMIILDEEHDASFKQQTGFRYSARDLALVRGKMENIPVILGSATPSLESIHNVQCQRFHYLPLPHRAQTNAQLHFQLLDIRNKKLSGGLSTVLLNKMQTHLANDGQILLFLNRRGYAPTLLCHHCGWIANCHRCDARLTYHQQHDQLFCHHCDSRRNLYRECPTCRHPELLLLGQGTERLAHVLRHYFPNIPIARIDRDTTRKKGSLQAILSSIQSGESKILIGTQMLAKGHHFPDVTLSAIIDVDSGLFSADFRGIERVGQLITQVAGRAGRAEKPGEVIIQTHFPDHPLLLQLIHKGYQTFSKHLLNERKATQFPPFSFMALLRAETVIEKTAMHFLMEVQQAISLNANTVQVLGPMPAPMERKAGRFRAQIVLKATKRADLQRCLPLLVNVIESLPSTRKVRWSLDIDPQEVF